MVLENKTIKQISDFVYVKPRTVQEIAFLLEKNWRTADSYVEKIIQEHGTLSVRTFREGTRGALKIVFWNNIEKIHSSSFQEKLFQRIERGLKKDDFSPFDIFQYVDETKRDAFVDICPENIVTEKQNMKGIMDQGEKIIFSLSGNLSWINNLQGKTRMLKVLEDAVKRKVEVKILTRVDIAALKNIKEVMAINERLGRQMIEIRHCEQPLRGIIIDNKIARFKEVKNPSMYKPGELNEKTHIFYNIYDPEWIDWLQKIFWNLFRTSIPAEKRIKDLQSIRGL